MELCPDENRLCAWLRRELPDGEKAAVDAHVSGCALCLEVVGALSSFSDPPGDAPPETIGRYVLLRTLGSGAFGVVHLAFDPQLNRRIALKVVRPPAGGATTLASDLLHEARSMARLSHPNVTAVHDVTVIDERVAITMEWIDGPDLRVWLGERPRRVDEVLRVFRDAGAGLAAAHDVGLVHRDFKPANILVGRAGRVAVTDFGLARAAGDAPEGSLAGTPAYMAPEQRERGTVDGRADQYAFGVSLWEAIAGARPPQAPHRIPRRLRRALERALSADPARRFPGMDALLEAVSPDALAPWRRPARRAAVLALALTPIAFAWSYSEHRSALCTGAADAVRESWDPDQHANLDGVTRGAIDDWFASWAKHHVEACEATRIRGEQSEHVLTARMACLERARIGAAVLVEEATRASTPERIREAVHALELPSRCMDAAPLLFEAAVPLEKADVAEALVVDLAKLRARRNLGRLSAAAEESGELTARARTVGHAPLLAEALLFEGQSWAMSGNLPRARERLIEATVAASHGRSDRTGAQAWIDLLHLSGREASADAAVGWRQAAVAAVARLPGDRLLQARLGSALGNTLAFHGQLADAVVQHRGALAIFDGLFGTPNPESAVQRQKVAELLEDLGFHREAVETAERARRELSVTHGAQHRLQALSLAVLADAHCSLGDYERCLEHAQHATLLRMSGPVEPPRQVLVARLLTHLRALTGLGREAEARAERERLARSIRELDEHDPWRARASHVLAPGAGSTARLMAALGPAHPEALSAQEEQALQQVPCGSAHNVLVAIADAKARVLGEQTPRLARTLRGIARCEIEQGRPADAREKLERALRLAKDQDPREASRALALLQTLAEPSSSPLQTPPPSP